MKTKTLKTTKVELLDEEINLLRDAWNLLVDIYDLKADGEYNFFEIPSKDYGWSSDEKIGEEEWRFMTETLNKLFNCGKFTVRTEEN